MRNDHRARIGLKRVELKGVGTMRNRTHIDLSSSRTHGSVTNLNLIYAFEVDTQSVFAPWHLLRDNRIVHAGVDLFGFRIEYDPPALLAEQFTDVNNNIRIDRINGAAVAVLFASCHAHGYQ